MRGLASPHPLLGCHFWQSCSVSTCWLRYASVVCALLGLTADTVHVSVFGGFWLLLHIFFNVKVETLEDSFWRMFVSAQCLVRQRIQLLRQSTELLRPLVPLVRRSPALRACWWIHVWRQFTRLWYVTHFPRER